MTKIKKETFLIARVTRSDKSIVENEAVKNGISVSEVIRLMIKFYNQESEKSK